MYIVQYIRIVCGSALRNKKSESFHNHAIDTSEWSQVRLKGTDMIMTKNMGVSPAWLSTYV